MNARNRFCLNWKVVASLALVGVAIWLVAPRFVVAALPLLVLAACPLSMIFMMRGMQQGQCRAPEARSHSGETGSEADRLRQVLSDLESRKRSVSRALAELQEGDGTGWDPEAEESLAAPRRAEDAR